MFPSAAMMREWRGVLHTLAGFENIRVDGASCFFNFILSNGTRSTQRDELWPTDYSFMIPADALHKIRSANIYNYNGDYIVGFKFFDKDGALLWEHGLICTDYENKTVVLEENEVIVGVVAKLLPGL